MARLRVVLLAVTALILAGFAVVQMKRPAPPEEPALGSVCRSRSGDERRTCYQRVLTGHLEKYGVANAMASLDTMATADSELAEHAHEFAHGVGIIAYRRAQDVVSIFGPCGDGFSSGCRHGVIQAYFQARERVSASDIEGLCRPFKSATSNRWILFQCVHGLGHGLTMFHAHDLPRALTDCDLLKNDWDRDSCYAGAFMENVVNAINSHHHGSFKPLNPDDPLYPCSISARRYWRACYQMQTSVMLHLNHSDIGDAGRSCERAPEVMRTVCFASLGRDITTLAARDPRKTADLCAQSVAEYRPSCYVGAAKALVDWTATTDAAFVFCGIVADQLPSAVASCYQALGEQIAILMQTVPQREEQCSRAEQPAAIAACRRGAQLL